jgi:hypothetical protein
MPVTPALLRLNGRWASAGDAFFTDPELAPFREWAQRSGPTTLSRYLVTHPGALLVEPARNSLYLLSPPGIPRLGGFPGLPYYESPTHSAVVPPLLGATLHPWGGWALGLLLASSLAGVAILRSRRAQLFVFAFLLVLVLPQLVLIWWWGGLDLGRHAAPVGVEIRLAGWALLALDMDSLIDRIRRRRAVAAKD